MHCGREWDLEDLIEGWTLDETELKELGDKSGATRLGFALMLKYFELEGRFPRREDVPRAAVEYLANRRTRPCRDTSDSRTATP